MVENSSSFESDPERLRFEVLRGLRATEHSNGTSLRGYIDIPHEQLRSHFGAPEEVLQGRGYKKDAQWVLLFVDGTVATIYNDSKGYVGPWWLEAFETRIWRVGGKQGSDVLERVMTVLDLFPKN